MHRLFLVGLNHGTAPLEVREKLAFNARQQREALAALRARFGAAEFVLLSTGNRVELYTAAEAASRPSEAQIVEFLASFRSVPADYFTPHLYRKTDRHVVDHLFNVAASLDSMVLGETQILGQVREAYDCARELSLTGAMLNPLFQKAIAVGKQVMTETPLGEGRLSIASVAVDYASRIFDRFADKTVLNIGAGKMASLVLRHFAALSPGRLLIANRSAAKAEALAAQFGGQAVALEQLAAHLVSADIVISSTGSAEPIITRAMFEKLRKARRYRPIFMIDIALPRDIEPDVAQIEHVYLYNLDDLQQVVSNTQLQRTDAIESARGIVAKHTAEFASWHRTRELGPLIDVLYRRSHELAREELNRTLNKLSNISETEKAHLEELTRRIVNKLLHNPISNLRRSNAAHVPMAQYLHALEKLFELDGARPDGGSPNAGSPDAGSPDIGQGDAALPDAVQGDLPETDDEPPIP